MRWEVDNKEKLKARMYVFVCELSARCKIAPWLQSKSMQSKQEMATIEETEGGGGGESYGGKETDGELDSPSEEERGSEFLAVQT